jgi:phosphoserine phosphatase
MNAKVEPASQYTGLILLSGIDKPGITQELFTTLSPFSVEILDIEQVVIRQRLILTVLISLAPAHSTSIEEDLSACAQRLDVDIATSFSEAEKTSIAAKTGLMHVVLLSQNLRPSGITEVAAAIADAGGNIERIHRSASFPLTAIEFLISGAPIDRLRTDLAAIAKAGGIDIAVQPGGLARWARKLVVMDVDSTLIEQEVIDLLARAHGVGEKVQTITESAMRGDLDFEDSLRARVALLEGAPASIIDTVAKEVTFTPGARTLIRTLHKLGHSVGLVSGGFSQIVNPIASELGITHIRSNVLEIIDGKVTGKLSGPIVDRAGKAIALKEFAKSEGLTLEQTVAIGDGANDLDMIAAAGLGIAFNAKPAVQAAADSALNAPYLDSVLYMLGISREDIESA